jgi:hypothetical protein
MLRPLALLVSAASFALFVFTPLAARADVFSSCGNIDVSSSAKCELDASVNCSARCVPLQFEASCAAQLEVSCNGSCTASADVNCTASCTAGSCEATCNADPGNFDCQGTCEADCDGHCQGQCASNSNQSECSASCKATCGGHCSAQCTGTPPSASCQARCQASCQGSCTAQANLSCDITCQSTGYVDCEAKLQGGCTAQCSQPKGALFCDGQFIDATNLQQCLDDLKNLLKITVQGDASGSCSGNQCSGQASGSVKACEVAPGNAPPLSGGLLALGLGAVVAGVVRRRSR